MPHHTGNQELGVVPRYGMWDQGFKEGVGSGSQAMGLGYILFLRSERSAAHFCGIRQPKVLSRF